MLNLDTHTLVALIIGEVSAAERARPDRHNLNF